MARLLEGPAEGVGEDGGSSASSARSIVGMAAPGADPPRAEAVLGIDALLAPNPPPAVISSESGGLSVSKTGGAISVASNSHRTLRVGVLITVAIPTCNRPADLDRCLASLAQVRYENWRLILVDQSDGDQSQRVAEAWRSQLPQLEYVRIKEKNASAARNLSIERGDGEVLAFLDDDCTVSPDWLDRVYAAFQRQPEASLIFGALSATPHDPDLALIPSYVPPRERRLRGRLSALRVGGFGASMYLRLMGAGRPRFDLLLGPGSRFRSTQDWDYAYRVLALGYLVVETPRIHVVHHGARPYATGSGREQLRNNRYGAGACHAKLLRCGEWILVAVIARKLAKTIAECRPQNALKRQPTHLGRSVMYLRGLRDGFRTPVDRPNLVFQSIER